MSHINSLNKNQQSAFFNFPIAYPPYWGRPLIAQCVLREGAEIRVFLNRHENFMQTI